MTSSGTNSPVHIGTDAAHPPFDTGGTGLKPLAASKMQYPEAREYPGSGKGTVRTGFAPDDFHAIGRGADGLDYRDGEA